MAISRRQPRGGLVHHSDQGSQHTSLASGERWRPPHPPRRRSTSAAPRHAMISGTPTSSTTASLTAPLGSPFTPASGAPKIAPWWPCGPRPPTSTPPRNRPNGPVLRHLPAEARHRRRPSPTLHFNPETPPPSTAMDLRSLQGDRHAPETVIGMSEQGDRHRRAPLRPRQPNRHHRTLRAPDPPGTLQARRVL